MGRIRSLFRFDTETKGLNTEPAKQVGIYHAGRSEFEGRNFCPRFYDMILTRIYGDYMSMPPEEDRIPHHGLVEVSL